MIKQLWITFYIAINVAFVGSLNSQSKYDDPEDMQKAADKFFEKENYIEAKPLYSQLLSLFPRRKIFSVKYGTCLLYMEDNIGEAKSFIRRGLSSTPLAYYQLGRAYHLSYEFSKAIEFYEKYKTIESPKILKNSDVDRNIQMCENGKTLLSRITDLEVIEKQKADRGKFYRLYNIDDIDGKILAYPQEGFQSKIDKKKKHIPVIFFLKDSKYVFFSSYGDKGENGLDIYRIRLQPDGNWGGKERLNDQINTPYDDDYPVFNPETGMLFFASKGHNSMGGYDIFKVEFNAESLECLSQVVNMDFAISTPYDDMLFIPDKKVELAYFASNRGSKQGEIFVYKVTVERTELQEIYISGKFNDQIVRSNKSATITVLDENTGEVVGTFETDPSTGEYLIKLPKGGDYKLDVKSKSTAETFSKKIEVPESESFKPYSQTLDLISEGGNTVVKVDNEFVDNTLSENDLALVLKEKSKLDVNAKKEEDSGDNISKEDTKEFVKNWLAFYKREEEKLNSLKTKIDQFNQKYIGEIDRLSVEVSKDLETKSNKSVMVDKQEAANSYYNKIKQSNEFEKELKSKQNQLKNLIEELKVDSEKLAVKSDYKLVQKWNQSINDWEGIKEVMSDSLSDARNNKNKLTSEYNELETSMQQANDGIEKLKEELTNTKKQSDKDRLNLQILDLENEKEAVKEEMDLLVAELEKNKKALDRLSEKKEVVYAIINNSVIPRIDAKVYSVTEVSSVLEKHEVNEEKVEVVKEQLINEGGYAINQSKSIVLDAESKRIIQRLKEYTSYPKIEKKVEDIVIRYESGVIEKEILHDELKRFEELVRPEDKKRLADNSASINPEKKELVENGNESMSSKDITKTSSESKSNDSKVEREDNRVSLVKEEQEKEKTKEEYINDNNTQKTIVNEDGDEEYIVEKESDQSKESNIVEEKSKTNNLETINTNVNNDELLVQENNKKENKQEGFEIKKGIQSPFQNNDSYQDYLNKKEELTDLYNEYGQIPDKQKEAKARYLERIKSLEEEINEYEASFFNSKSGLFKQFNSNEEFENIGSTISDLIALKEQKKELQKKYDKNKEKYQAEYNDLNKRIDSKEIEILELWNNAYTKAIKRSDVSLADDNKVEELVVEISNIQYKIENDEYDEDYVDVLKLLIENKSKLLGYLSNKSPKESSGNDVVDDELVFNNQLEQENDIETSDNVALASGNNNDSVLEDDSSTDDRVEVEDEVEPKEPIKRISNQKVSSEDVTGQLVSVGDELARLKEQYKTASNEEKKIIKRSFIEYGGELKSLTVINDAQQYIKENANTSNEKKLSNSYALSNKYISSRKEIEKEIVELVRKLQDVSLSKTDKNQIEDQINTLEFALKRLDKIIELQLAKEQEENYKLISKYDSQPEVVAVFEESMKALSSIKENIRIKEIELSELVIAFEREKNPIEKQEYSNSISELENSLKDDRLNLEALLQKLDILINKLEGGSTPVGLTTQDKEKTTSSKLSSESSKDVKTESSTKIGNDVTTDDAEEIKTIEVQLISKEESFYNKSKPIPVIEQIEKGLFFKVQVGAFRNPIPQDHFKGFTPVVGENVVDDIVRYTVGKYVGFDKADKAKNMVREIGYSDAFVVAYYNGKRISISKARELISSGIVTPQSDEDNVQVDLSTSNKQDEYVPIVSLEVKKKFEENNTIIVNTIKGTFLAIQLGVFKQPRTSDKLAGVEPLNVEILDNGLYRYSSGSFKDLDKARERAAEIRSKGRDDAFIVGYIDGKRVYLKEAMKSLNN